MRVSILIEASQPCGKQFRLALGVYLPLTLIWAVLRLAGLV